MGWGAAPIPGGWRGRGGEATKSLYYHEVAKPAHAPPALRSPAGARAGRGVCAWPPASPPPAPPPRPRGRRGEGGACVFLRRAPRLLSGSRRRRSRLSSRGCRSCRLHTAWAAGAGLGSGGRARGPGGTPGRAAEESPGGGGGRGTRSASPPPPSLSFALFSHTPGRRLGFVRGDGVASWPSPGAAGHLSPVSQLRPRPWRTDPWTRRLPRLPAAGEASAPPAP